MVRMDQRGLREGRAGHLSPGCDKALNATSPIRAAGCSPFRFLAIQRFAVAFLLPFIRTAKVLSLLPEGKIL